jgi:hypothetical protein
VRSKIEGEIMLKAICKNMVWMALPLTLALGCATNRPQAEATSSESTASYGPVETLTPTSGEPEQRIYSNVDPGTLNADTSMSAAPAGVNPANWQVAEAIRQKLMTDHSLSRVGDSVVAEVGADGAVTLKGKVSSQSEKERVSEGIAKLPGVTGVNDDQMGIGRAVGNNGMLDMR